MKEHKIILKDLQEYLRGKGIKAELEEGLHAYDERLCVDDGYSYVVRDSQICLFFSERPIVALADPGYREKFYERSKDPFMKEGKVSPKRKWKNTKLY